MARKIELKTIPMVIHGVAEGQSLYYAAQIADLLRTPRSRDGVSMDEMLLVGPMLEKVNDHAAAEHIILEEAEYKAVMERLATFKFAFVHSAIVQFIEDMQAAPKVPVVEAVEK